jgi:uncharacterized protein with von Willebrand factor type A (vWA) domain
MELSATNAKTTEERNYTWSIDAFVQNDQTDHSRIKSYGMAHALMRDDKLVYVTISDDSNSQVTKTLITYHRVVSIRITNSRNRQHAVDARKSSRLATATFGLSIKPRMQILASLHA